MYFAKNNTPSELLSNVKYVNKMADVVESYEHVEIQKLRTEVEQEKEMK